MNKDNIVLVGFAGTGKSTVSKILASYLADWNVVDTDAEIEHQEGKTIPDIFGSQGESYFRSVESKVIGDVLQRSYQIISTGGGAVLNKANCQLMLDNGLVIALTASPQIIIDRVKKDSNRPLFHGGVEEKVMKLLKDREHAYDFAHITIDTSDLSADEVAKFILNERDR